MNSIKLLTEHCKFENENHVYVLLAVARKKDNEHITHNTEIVFREVIKRESDIVRKYNKLMSAVTNYRDEEGHSYNFYVYITINPRDVMKAYFKLQSDVNNWLGQRLAGYKNENFKKLDGFWISALMKNESRGNRGKFLIDCDTKNSVIIENLKLFLEVNSIVIYNMRETRNGFHLITSPFDRSKFPMYTGIEVKIDSLLFVEYVEKDYDDILIDVGE